MHFPFDFKSNRSNKGTRELQRVLVSELDQCSSSTLLPFSLKMGIRYVDTDNLPYSHSIATVYPLFLSGH